MPVKVREVRYPMEMGLYHAHLCREAERYKRGEIEFWQLPGALVPERSYPIIFDEEGGILS